MEWRSPAAPYRPGSLGEMDPAVAAAAFGLVGLGELPDKTMFANLLMSARGRPLAVWVGAAAAFASHVAIAVGVGATAVALVPRAALDVATGAVLLAAAAWSWHERGGAGEQVPTPGTGAGHRVALRAGLVIWLAEWGDLTQVLTADLAARSRHPWSVAAGALAALWVVAALAVLGGSRLLGRVPVRRLRTVTAMVLTALGVLAIAGGAVA